MPGAAVYIGFGSNLGERLETINRALTELGRLPETFLGGLSPLYESAPVGYLDQGPFLNGVARLDTALSARRLLERLLAIEKKLGRVRGIRWGPRTIDLDIIIFGRAVIADEDLVVPHPEYVRRRFVLEPLAELAPGLVCPRSGRTIGRLLQQQILTHPEEVPLSRVAEPPAGNPSEVKDGIFYRYRQP